MNSPLRHRNKSPEVRRCLDPHRRSLCCGPACSVGGGKCPIWLRRPGRGKKYLKWAREKAARRPQRHRSAGHRPLACSDRTVCAARCLAAGAGQTAVGVFLLCHVRSRASGHRPSSTCFPDLSKKISYLGFVH